jgi:NTP pyrophosphatase (non-canonical NTP hydrolase)
MGEIKYLDHYQYMSKRTIDLTKSRKDNVTNFAISLAEESGEVLGIIKKHLYHGHGLDLDELENELGDVLWYVAALATLYGLRLEVIANKNHSKILKRYPDGFSEADSVNRID